MDKSNTTLDEFRYHRGYAKYADIARLFGWQADSEKFLVPGESGLQRRCTYLFRKTDLQSDGLSQTDSRISSGYTLSVKGS